MKVEIVPIPQLISEAQYLKESNGVSSKLLACSYNKNTTLSKDTKLVIVGTLTPPDTAYFYCSFYNRIYGYIDEALKKLGRGGTKTLKELKRGLQEVHNERVNINLVNETEISSKVTSIKEILLKNGIAFLDVMDKAIRSRESPYDEDIKYYTLAKNDFKEINSSTTIIANSNLAKKCACEIGLKNVELLSQRFGKKRVWVEAIVQAIK